MALVVDRFQFLADEIASLFSSFRDGFAVIGALYAARKAVSATCRLWHGCKTYGFPSMARSTDFVKVYGQWAVITGASRGIGAVYANELAARGMNLLLVSRDAFQLKDTCSCLEKTFRVKTIAVSIDFNEGKTAYDKIRPHIDDKEIGILVNNVGVMYDYPQHFLDVPYEKLWQLVHVNVAAATMMIHLILPQMIQRGRGAVITISSGASFLPTPQMTVYAATKQYLKCFMKGLEYEYRSTGITFQCLLPFYVATRMTQYSSTLSNPSLFIPTATTYVRHALATLGWARETPGYWPHSLQLWLAGFVPERLWMWGALRLNNALRRQAHHRLRNRSGDAASQRLQTVSQPPSKLIG